ncbi:MAG: RtcB family protein [Candidatus Woesearchaeota archaeon]
MKLKKINEYSYIIEKEGSMNTDVKIFASEVLMNKMKEDKCLQQGVNTAHLPGIFGPSIMMPDAHQGYGFSIGGVAATDTKKGCISPGGVGFDINCGVRLLTTNLKRKEVEEKIEELLNSLFKNIPPGVGGKSIFRLTTEELDEVLKRGPSFFVEREIGLKEDVDMCESSGVMQNANPEKVSDKAKKRGKAQLGTLGSGNHFLEIQFVDKIYDKEKAKKFGILQENQVVVLIHTGSRGLGHQVCSDYLRLIEEEHKDIIDSLPDKNLAFAPAQSTLAKDYYEAMCSAANFAWSNRHVIGHQTRKSFKEIFGEEVVLETVYDVAHNIAKIEEHTYKGVTKDVWVHRKGATRAFGPGHKEIPKKYQETGQPIFIPGSMGTSSYVLAGTNKAMEESFGSTAHGAGRLLSRHKANSNFTGEGIKKELKDMKIHVKAASMRGISEEAPKAYKDVDEVVEVSHKAGIGVLVSKVKPIGVIKG